MHVALSKQPCFRGLLCKKENEGNFRELKPPLSPDFLFCAGMLCCTKWKVQFLFANYMDGINFSARQNGIVNGQLMKCFAANLLRSLTETGKSQLVVNHGINFLMNCRYFNLHDFLVERCCLKLKISFRFGNVDHSVDFLGRELDIFIMKSSSDNMCSQSIQSFLKRLLRKVPAKYLIIPFPLKKPISEQNVANRKKSDAQKLQGTRGFP